MSETETYPTDSTDPNEYAARHAWHCGALSYAVAHALYQLERHDKDGPAPDLDAAVRVLRQAWGPYVDSGLCPDYLADHPWAGFVVESATGEAQAFRPTLAQAIAAVPLVESYWHEAEVCGHPDAPGYVRKLRPFRVRQVSAGEAAELREYPAVIDREP